jgi:KaiC/GvpD/RAD55 family RecA-like ATPase
MTASEAPRDRPAAPLCDFCGLPCPPTPVTDEVRGDVYEFCSESCRDALRAGDGGNAAFHGLERFDPSVPLLSSQLPDGMPRNSFVLLADHVGTRGDALLVELAWQLLQRGGSAVFVTYQEPPSSLVEQFLALRWNVFPYLESGQLRIVDCFTYRLDDAERMVDRMNRWTRHIHRATTPATAAVRDPTDLRSVCNKLDDALLAADARDRGLVAFDSLTELGTLVQPTLAYDFVKDLRADVCKGRFVPVFARAPYRGDTEEFPHDLSYVMDGLVEMRTEERRAAGPINQVRVRKMRGVPTTPRWTPYEYLGDQGLVSSRPRTAPPADRTDGAARRDEVR